ncbi:MAG: insulinase family protein [Rhodospirillales bacterium]|nr:insulinase family protein [Alphaproteobacteria bacterium]MCB9986348.1 insulinase family protein [Rhodospirillales bacterium]USO07103.1 MAG: insulinase family protein [Rhodospirillales bacterium]
MMPRFLLAVFLYLALALPALASTAVPGRVLDIQSFKTPNGITVWLVEDHSLPVIALSFAIKGGASLDPAGRQGVSQLLSNTLDEGAGEIKSPEFQGALRDNAIDLRFASDRDDFSGSLRTLTRHQDKAFDLLHLALRAPRFDPDAVERMKQANLTRIRSAMTDADWIGARLSNDLSFKGHPYARNIGGTLAGMNALTPADLHDAWLRDVARDRLFVGVSGDMTKDQAASAVDRIFGDLPVGAKQAALPESPMPAPEKPVFYATPQPQTNMTLIWPGIGLHDPDHYAAVVMDYIYGGGGFSSLLMDEVREKRGLTYGIYSGMTNLDHADRYTVMASMQPQNVASSVETVEAIADRMKNQDVSADRLAAAKEYLIGSLPLSFSSTRAIAGALTALQVNGRPVSAYDDYREKIAKVTPADIRRAAARIFNQKPQIILVGAKPQGLDVNTITVLPDVEGSVTK